MRAAMVQMMMPGVGHCCYHGKLQVYQITRLVVLFGWVVLPGFAQGNQLSDKPASDKASPPQKFKFTFELRSRLEGRTGVTFGRDPDQENPLFRTRVGFEWRPNDWIKVSATGQDARAPFYGTPAPATVRDTMDLHEGYIELFGSRKLGFGAQFGRYQLSYGEGRLIGVPQWGNIARTYDMGRVFYRWPQLRLEFVFTSIVKIRPDDFNKPVLGDRVWGTYNAFPKAIRGGVVEAYVLRHDQNVPGGFAGPGSLGINTFGGRATGPLPAGLRYSLESAVQTGHVGTKTHRAGAWFSNISRTVRLGLPLDLAGEYKYASGSDDPRGPRSGTFDQLYPASHDKFGHADLFGWRNIHNIRSLNTLHITKSLLLNFMYNSIWLASPADSLYNGQGRAIVRSATGKDGRHVGEEVDVFGVYRRGPFQMGMGFAQLFPGEYLKRVSPGVGTRYYYMFQTWTH